MSEPAGGAVAPEQKKPGHTKWVVAWLLWGLLFLIIEGLALFNKEKGDTLSENLRSWGGIKTPERKGAQWGVFAALLVFFVWFPLHILTGQV